MTTVEKTTKPRPIYMKKGSYKYLLELLHGIKRELRDVRNTQRIIAKGLEHYFVFNEGFIAKVACRDEVDQAILEMLKTSPASGILPRRRSNCAKEALVNGQWPFGGAKEAPKFEPRRRCTRLVRF